MREDISKSIDKLMNKFSLASLDSDAEKLNQEIAFTQDRLYECLNSTSSFDAKVDLETFVLSDKDPIGRIETESISENESFVECVRDIQNDIINEFLEFDIARGVNLLQNDA